jgi:hypothetical protein
MLMAVNAAVPGGAWFTELSFESPTTLVIKGDAVNDEAIVNVEVFDAVLVLLDVVEGVNVTVRADVFDSNPVRV